MSKVVVWWQYDSKSAPAITVHALRENKRPIGFAPWPEEAEPEEVTPKKKGTKGMKTEHNGAKNGGGFWGPRAEAKRASKKRRRRADRNVEA